MAPTIDRERLFSRVRELCAINAPSRCEQPIFRYLQKFWLERKESGLTWETVAVVSPNCEYHHAPGRYG